MTKCVKVEMKDSEANKKVSKFAAYKHDQNLPPPATGSGASPIPEASICTGRSQAAKPAARQTSTKPTTAKQPGKSTYKTPTSVLATAKSHWKCEQWTDHPGATTKRQYQSTKATTSTSGIWVLWLLRWDRSPPLRLQMWWSSEMSHLWGTHPQSQILSSLSIGPWPWGEAIALPSWSANFKK